MDDMLIAVFNHMSKEHDATLDKVLIICRKASLDPNKDKCLFWYTSITFFGEVIA